VSATAQDIFREIHLENNLKTVPLANVGGVAGGDKYIKDGILYKLYKKGKVLSEHFMASKSAATELRVANALFRFVYQHDLPVVVPPIMLLDRLDQRLVAMPLLPLAEDGLIYGSADAGKTVHASSKAFNTIVQFLAQKLHLAGHVVEGSELGSELLYMAGDVEGHRGSDGRCYLLDLGRVFPPEDPRKVDFLDNFGYSSIFFRFLRPELLQGLPTTSNLPPASSDAFTAWGKHDSNRHNRNCGQATQFLLTDVLPQLAAHLTEEHKQDTFNIDAAVKPYLELNPLLTEQMSIFVSEWRGRSLEVGFDGANFGNRLFGGVFAMYKKIAFKGPNPQGIPTDPSLEQNWNTFTSTVDVAARMHAVGAPVRLLGQLRSLLTTPQLREACLKAILQRSIKGVLRQRVNDGLTKQLGSADLEALVRSEPGADSFWTSVQAVVLSRFGCGEFRQGEDSMLLLSQTVRTFSTEIVSYVRLRLGEDCPFIKGMSFLDILKAESLLNTAADLATLPMMGKRVTQVLDLCDNLQRTAAGDLRALELQQQAQTCRDLLLNPKNDPEEIRRARAFATFFSELGTEQTAEPGHLVCATVFSQMENATQSKLLLETTQFGAGKFLTTEPTYRLKMCDFFPV
jgi:hypothetical protein